MSSGGTTKIMGVSGSAPDRPHRLLFDALSGLYPVEFREVDASEREAVDGLIVLDGKVEAGMKAAMRGIPAYVVFKGHPGVVAYAQPEVKIGASAELDPCLRDQVLTDNHAGAMRPLPTQSGDEVLAARGAHTIWLSRPTGKAKCQLVAFSPPALAQNECLFQHFNGVKFLRLLPLMHFVRWLVKDIDWQSPPSRACFVIDDPSLYWPSYGFINYRRLAEHARRHGYFVSIASIPIDSWWVNRAVAATFRSDDWRLSVLIHGNNHTSRELLPEEDGTASVAAVAQALPRMERLQKKHGIPVFKIMVAPHGAIDNALFPHLLGLGYEAALVTTDLLVQHNPRAGWPATIGMGKSELLGGGLPVIPRIKMSPYWKNDTILAVFLKQPIVIAGHHQDAQHDLEALADIASTINNLTGVTWSDMQGVLRANYLQKIEADLLTVRMYSRHVKVPIPPGVDRVCVERPWLSEDQTEKLTVESNREPVFSGAVGTLSGALSVGGKKVIEVFSEVPQPLLSGSVTPPGINPWPIARKVLMEIRDRLSPALPFLARPAQWTDHSTE